MHAAESEIAFLLEDYRESWSHYRHIEDARLRYLSFFFTASLGSTAIVAPVIAAAAVGTNLKLIAGAAFLAVFLAFTFFVFVAVNRFGWVLRHYDIAMRANRHRRAELSKVPESSEKMVDTMYSATLQPKSFRIQKTAEVTLVSFLLAGLLLAATAAYFAARLANWATLGGCVVVVLAAALASLLAIVTRARSATAARAGSTPR